MKFKKIHNIWLVGLLSVWMVGCSSSSDNSSTSDDTNESSVIAVTKSEKDLVPNFLYLDDQDLVVLAKDSVEGAILAEDFKGRVNKAYEFDGVSNAIEIPHNDKFNIQDKITLSAWVYTSEKRSAVIIRKGPEVNGDTHAPYELAISATGDAIFSLNLPLDDDDNRTWVQVRSGYSDKSWFHIVGTYDGTSMKLYINGDLVNAKDATGKMNTNQSPLLIGTRLKLPSSTWKGKIADVRIYTRALSSDEIDKLYNQ